MVLTANALIEALSLPNVRLKFTKNVVMGNFDAEPVVSDNATFQAPG